MASPQLTPTAVKARKVKSLLASYYSTEEAAAQASTPKHGDRCVGGAGRGACVDTGQTRELRNEAVCTRRHALACGLCLREYGHQVWKDFYNCNCWLPYLHFCRAPYAGSTSVSSPSSQRSLAGTPDAQARLDRMLREAPLADLLAYQKEISTEVGSLDSDMQMLVYENYSKFITATDTIRSMGGAMDGIHQRVELLTTLLGTTRCRCKWNEADFASVPTRS